MTKEEYAQYEAAVSDFFKTEGISNLNCIGDNPEPYFSWKRCDCCLSFFGGDRYDAHGYNPTTKEIQEYSVCPDCIYYAAYGQLDDTTMLGIKEQL